MRYLVFIFIYLIGFSLAYAQTKGNKKNETTKKTKKMEITSSTPSKSYTGVILEKPWSKSTQSYCAQGSDYFVLKIEEQEWVIENKSGVDLKKYHEKEVTLTGFEQTRKIPTPQDPFSQHPVTPSFVIKDGKPVPVKDEGFSCTVLVVEKIN